MRLRQEQFSDEEIQAVREVLPEIGELTNPDLQEKVAKVWVSFHRESNFKRIEDAPKFAFAGISLVAHTRQVVQLCIATAEIQKRMMGLDCDRDALIAAALLHDVSQLIEFADAKGTPSEVGDTFLHAQVGGVRCYELGLPSKVAFMVSLHPFTPPHVHVEPKYMEFVLLTWADISAADAVFFAHGLPTHLEFKKRFFQL